MPSAARADAVEPSESAQHVGWWALAAAADIRDRPIAARLAGSEIALYRDASGVVRAVDDLCPHRRLPLSLGRVTPDGQLQCGYHGWIFDGGSGRCTAIPNLSDDEKPSGRIRLPVYTTGTWGDLVLVWNGAGPAPAVPVATLSGPSPTMSGAVEVRSPVELVLDALALNPGGALGLGAVLGSGEEEAAVDVQVQAGAVHVRRTRQTLDLPRVGTFDPFIDRVTSTTTALHPGTGLVEVLADRGLGGTTALVTVGVAPITAHRTSVHWTLGVAGRSAAVLRAAIVASVAIRRRTGRAAAAFARQTDDVESLHDPATELLRSLRAGSEHLLVSHDLYEELS